LRRLGFEERARVVVVHVDDMGLCAAANEGALFALAGSATSGSIMVPWPGFDDLCERIQDLPGLDLGVHLTLNGEQSKSRWQPIRDDVPSLLSPGGGMWPTKSETVAHAKVEEVEAELRAQIDKALASGIDVTHLDTHMGTIFDLKFIEVYLRLALDYRLPVFLPRIRRELLPAHGLPDEFERYLELAARVEAEGLPIFDHFDSNSLHFEPGKGLEHNRARVAKLGPGLSYLITHCARGNEQLRALTEDWRQRDEECRIYSDGSMEAFLREEGFERIGMRALRTLLREVL